MTDRPNNPDECIDLAIEVVALRKAVATERAKVKSLSEAIESQKQTHDALIKKCRELENRDAYNQAYINNHADIIKTLQAQSAVMLEALTLLKDNRGKCFIPDDFYSASGWCFDTLMDQALSLTPSDAAGMVLVPKVPTHEMIMEMSMCCGGSYDQIKENWPRMIEAAREAGVTTEDNQ